MVYSNFNNPLSPYCICEIHIHQTNFNIDSEFIRVILHSDPPVKNSFVYKFFGQLEETEKYGKSFKCDTYIRDIPIDKAHVVDFLGSGLFHGIKKKRAIKIVDTFGEDCLIKIVNTPEILRDIKGIPEKTIESIQEVIVENLGMQDIITKLHEWNITINLAKRIFRMYGDASVQKITENPYCLANAVRGIGFKKADEIADHIDIRGEDGRRIKGAIEHTLHQIYEEEGSTYAHKGYVMQKASKILFDQDHLRYPSELIENNLEELVSNNVTELLDFTTDIGQVYQTGNNIYLSKYYNYEFAIAKKISNINSIREPLKPEDMTRLFNLFDVLLADLPFIPSEEQQLAVLASVIDHVVIITGGPGTGKSTILKLILRLYKELECLDHFTQFQEKVILLAPTGRAAKRMTELTQVQAQTIHHFLMTRKGQSKFTEGRLFIIDEMSMMDISMMSQLLEHLHKGDRLILVGDKEQLPPIKAGNVFVDIIETESFTAVELKTVFRQHEESTINELAASIRTGDISEKLLTPSGDVNLLSVKRDSITKTIETEILSALDRQVSFDDIQIIAPIHNGEQGIIFINTYVQNLLYEGKLPSANPHVPTGFTNQFYKFHLHDRVMQLKNNKEKYVLNGDIGVVIKVIPITEVIEMNEITGIEEVVEDPPKIIVSFDGREIAYYQQELQELSLAYCFSVHKAQGSEFPSIILPISRSHLHFMNRNLLYTAITRAKNELTIVGELETFLIALERKPKKRYTFLKDLLLKMK